MFKIEINAAFILSLLSLIVGIVLYIGWGVAYGVWADIGIYSITILFVLAGVFGLLLSFFSKEDDE